MYYYLIYFFVSFFFLLFFKTALTSVCVYIIYRIFRLRSVFYYMKRTFSLYLSKLFKMYLLYKYGMCWIFLTKTSSLFFIHKYIIISSSLLTKNRAERCKPTVYSCKQWEQTRQIYVFAFFLWNTAFLRMQPSF